MKYSKLSELPSEIKDKITSNYNSIKCLYDLLGRKLRRSGRLTRRITRLHNCIDPEDLYSINVLYPNDISTELKNAYNELYIMTSDFNKTSTEIVVIKKEIDIRQENLETYMKSEGLDLDDRSCDEDLYEFIHGVNIIND